MYNVNGSIILYNTYNMPTKPQNSGKKWTSLDEQALKKLIAQNTPTRVMGIKLKRTPEAIYSHASEIGKSLKPVNQRPYNRLKK